MHQFKYVCWRAYRGRIGAELFTALYRSVVIGQNPVPINFFYGIFFLNHPLETWSRGLFSSSTSLS